MIAHACGNQPAHTQTAEQAHTHTHTWKHCVCTHLGAKGFDEGVDVVLADGVAFANSSIETINAAPLPHLAGSSVYRRH